MTLIEISLKQNYFIQENRWFSSEAQLSSDEGQKYLQTQLYGRLDGFRDTIIPWLNNAKPLNGSRILEIGSGTGSSTVALAEQGADVTAVDIIEKGLIVAKERSEIYGLNVNFLCANATEVNKNFIGQHFDFIIFFASLELMTINVKNDCHEEYLGYALTRWFMVRDRDA